MARIAWAVACYVHLTLAGEAEVRSVRLISSFFAALSFFGALGLVPALFGRGRPRAEPQD